MTDFWMGFLYGIMAVGVPLLSLLTIAMIKVASEGASNDSDESRR